jgi:hypothetical protein
MVEGALAKAVPVTIGFLAGLLGLGDIGGTIKNTIDKVKEPINKAIDWVINLAAKGVKAVGKLLGFGKDKPDERTPEQKQSDLDQGVAEATTLLKDEKLSSDQIKKRLPSIQSKYRMTVLELVTDAKSETTETDHIHGEINPKKTSDQVVKERTDRHPSRFVMEVEQDGKWKLLPEYRGSFKIRTRFYRSGDGYNADAIARRDAIISANEDPGNKSNWKHPIYTGGESVPKTDYTIEHSPSVAEHWNKVGNSTIQADRVAWFRFDSRTDEVIVLSRSENSRRGSGGVTFSEDVDLNFRGPGE